MKCSISLLAGALLAVSFASSARALDSQEVGYNIEARGAAPVVAQLAKAGQLQAVEDSIRLGDDSWIALAPKLANGGNARFTTGIKSALSSALVYNPAAVLHALNKGNNLPINDICTAPPEVQGDTAITSFRQRATHALSMVRVGDLSAPRDACIAALKG
ncbi:Uncharacterised protein [Serratia entomophila]|jgi:hypothetical protein|uniref:Uncharacterized protein n=1 Tax=Serratia entomophila TaxID=42906 RepID=A0ABY5CQR1_9GAMM|nr:hypothetical protein [Serratia entomophila]UIW17870.1 hypothetical protein KHA73_21010 [Serratia entomophila]USV00466.1 hypothetical protein KFQ06_20980 [Serratia entomophila]CAI0702439.1 Uncharacterised protein [Serratia entomophila]CAI0754643.1 Uncharacterised protein [Serratia entomophila]CAI0924129.1 Uncharacterised protein [Serratia entomophila]